MPTDSTLIDQPLNQQPIIEMVMNYRASKIMLVAVSLDFFTLINGGKKTAIEIAKAAKTNLRATIVLLDSLVSLELLKKSGETYGNMPVSDAYLVEGKPGYLGNNLKYQEIIWDAWSQLRPVVSSGQPARSLDDWIFRHKTFGQEYIKGMENIAQRPAREIADLFPRTGARALLDVGAGPGTYSLAFLERHASLTATLLDLEPTIAISKKIVGSHLHANRVRFLEGDYRSQDFGNKEFDFILMSHITHNEGPQENNRLFKKAFDALRPGGHIIVHDFMTDEHKTSPTFAALFSVHMLVYTREGKVYSSDEYVSMLKGAFFTNVRKYDICKTSPNSSVALVATRPIR